ncbi:MAG: DUF6680 family protein [Lentilitoribacter sp.]
MTPNAILTLIAIFTGPIVAVLITWILDRKYKAYDRRLKIFRDLMQTRGLRLDPQHVAALNLIQLEFYKKSTILEAFEKYIEHLNHSPPEKDSDQKAFSDRRSELFMDLLREIGQNVGCKFDKMELDRRSYVPIGWHDNNNLQQKNAQLLSAVLMGQRPIPITNFLLNGGNNPFPKAPQIEQNDK